MSFRKHWEVRIPHGDKKTEKALFEMALAYRDAVRKKLKQIDVPAFHLHAEEVDDLAAVVAALAEDLHADGGLWRGLESCQRAILGVPLPMMSREGDAELETFDARRFRFFLYTIWPLLQPRTILSPIHRELLALAEHASDFFRDAFARFPRKSPVAEFLAGSNDRGWEVKRKLIWLGTKSFLFRLFYRDYIARNAPPPGEAIATTDDFLCQECTAWSGLGAIDLLAAVLDLPEEDRVLLRGWHERHAAIYRVAEVSAVGTDEELLETVNEINGQVYRVRMGIDPRSRPFLPGMHVLGSLVPWRGDWYWSGVQRIVSLSPDELAEVRGKFRQNGKFSYRYCRDLEQKAREYEAQQHSAFLEYYGKDLVVFPDGAAAAASESQRLNLPGLMEGLADSQDEVAVFYHAGEGIEAFTCFGTLRTALKRQDGILLEDELDALQAFMEEDSISPAFVHRVVAETGSAGVEALYFLPEDSREGIEYLLRRFKGSYYRKRYPAITLRE